MTVAEAQRCCLKQGIPFYSYRLPEGQKTYFGAQTEGEVACFRKFSGQEKGFIMVPFSESEKVLAWFIREDIGFQDATSNIGILELLSPAKGKKYVDTVLEADVCWEEYKQQVETMVEVLKQGDMDKMVLSRTITRHIDAFEKATAWFTALANRYPEAFVFLVFVPGEMCWLGATPEIFLRQSEVGTETMALAGTRSYGSREEWGKKEIEEQAIVTDYIAGVLQGVCGKSWEQEGPFSKQAGKVEHLCTTFRKEGHLAVELTDQLRQGLHPTPAVGGVPPRKALRMIRQIEGRDRRYYAGYLGPVSDTGCFDWYVNLRCMELWPEKIRLYVGGGITSLSESRKEWEETELKSRTLLDVIQIMDNGDVSEKYGEVDYR